ncbi:MAG: hypothetical protein ACPIOQ_51470, partial [Promethearchaeia archaeon]
MVGIPRTVMAVNQEPLSLGGSQAALSTIEPMFTVREVAQSSSTPCDKNTITATLSTNVPMPSGTLITLTGIVPAQTNSTSQLVITSNNASNVSCLNSTGIWDQDTGSVIVQAVADTCIENTSWVDFAGNTCADYQANTTMCDTAAQRIQPVVNASAHANFYSGQGSAMDECCACSWPRRGALWGCAFSFQLDNPAAASAGVVPQVKATICTSCSETTDFMHGTVMAVSPLNFESTISQSSPFPCDTNTIKVVLSHMVVPVMAQCNPTVTISGLRNAIADDGHIAVTDLLDSQSKNGTWSTSVSDGADGPVTESTLKLRLSDFIVGSNQSDFEFSFEVVNPNFAQDAPNVLIQAHIHGPGHTSSALSAPNEQTMAPRSMLSPTPTVYDFTTGQDGQPVPFFTQANSSQLSAMVKNESGVLKT